jgi:predicted nucleic acid-binding protein
MTGQQVFVFDSEALSKAVRGDRELLALLDLARTEGIPVAITPMTMVEADDGKVHAARWDWLLSRLRIAAIGVDQGRAAQRLRRETGMHGHKDVIDTFLAVAAIEQPGNVTVFTSDRDDLEQLLADHPRIVVRAVRLPPHEHEARSCLMASAGITRGQHR